MTVLCYKENAQIYHANDYNTLIIGWVAARLRRAKIVYDTHEIWSENHDIAKQKVIKSIVKFFESFFIRRVDRVVCVSHAAADYLSQLYKIKTPDVITNCAWREGNAAIDDNHPTDNNHFEVLNHGQFYDGRGYDLLIQSAAFLKTYQGKIKIVMRGFGRCETKYRNLVKTENADGLVQFVPPVRVDQLVSAASSSHIGVAITEGFCVNFKCSISNKIFEYLAAGLPVIMSDIPEHRYYNERYHFGIILENLLPETIANAIINIYEDKDLYDRLKSNALLARKVLCWEVEGEKWILLYRNLLKQQ